MAEPTDADLFRLRDAATEAAKENGWNTEDDPPLAGRCAAVACMVRGMFGGTILEGYVGGSLHYWNRLKDGREVDLTACQFGENGLEPIAEGFPVSHDRVGLHDTFFAYQVLQQLKATQC